MEKSPVIVTGHRVMEDGSISVLVKDKVSNANPLRRLSTTQAATKSGSFWINKGNNLETVTTAYPVGALVTGAQWGESLNIPTKDGTIAPIYSVVFDEDEEKGE